MADYSPHQKKIIKRYYDNADAIGYQRLSELVTEIYLAEGRALDRLWKQVATALKKTQTPTSRQEHILGQRDVKLLAELVKELGRG